MRIIRKTPLAKNRKLGISAFVLPVLLATVFLLPGCNMFNKPLSDFLEYWTDVAQISRHSFDGSYPETDGLTNLPAGADRVITCYVINPQNYVLTPSATFASGSLTQGSDYSIEQDASDRTVLRLTLKDSYLQSLDGTGTGISPTVSITEPNSGRNFGSYSVPLRVNSAPDGVKSPVVLRSGSSPETYILCFNMPDATKANGDIETISVDGNSFNRTYTVDMQNGTISGTGTIYTTKNASWQPVVNGAADFIGDESNRFVGINTGIPLSGDTVSFTVTTNDSYGLSTSVEAGATASKLELPTSNPSSGSILQVGNSVTIRHPASSGVNRTLDVHVTDGNSYNVNIQTGNSDVTVTFKASGTYTLSAVAKMTGAADSEEVTFTYTVRASAVYVSEDGDDGASGTEDKPVETLQRAIKLLDEAQFTEGEIVVTGTVQTGEVKIDTSDGTTESLKTLTVRGSTDGGTLENKNGRVFTIGSGGSLTLGENITLTGTVTDDKGGAVYVDGGTFTMERGSKITGSSATDNGGAVYVAGGGEFNMNDGSKITGSSATDTMSYGGAVFIFNGTFNMNGGVIGGTGDEKNTAVCGGGVYVFTDGIFNMSGNAQIQGNEATGKGTIDGGGGVYVINGGNFTMSGGTIGGDGENDANTAQYGGGVFVSSKGTFNMSGTATIKGNNSSTHGGGVYVGSTGTFTVGGTPIITDNTANSNDNNNDNNNVYLYSGKTITIGDDFTGGSIGVTAAAMCEGTAVQITDKNVNNAASIFTSDVESYRIEENVNVSSGGTAVFLSDTETSYSTGGNGGVSLGDFNDAFNAIESTGGDITVFKPVEITEPTTIFPSSGVTIDITASGETTVFDVQEGGSLTLGGGYGVVNVSGDPNASSPTADGKEISLINISRGGTVTIADNANIQNNRAGRGVTVADGKLIMTGGSIKDNTGGYNYGSGVYVSGQNASFEMSGGEISGNTLKLNSDSLRQGAGVMVCNGAKFTLSDSGKITGNSGYEGVGVTVSGSTFNMNGGEISDNNGSGTSGGVYLISGSTMNMNGGQITSNKAAKTFKDGGAGGVFIGLSCTFTGSTDPDTTASITENYVANTNVDVYVQDGGNYNKGYVQVDAKKP